MSLVMRGISAARSARLVLSCGVKSSELVCLRHPAPCVRYQTRSHWQAVLTKSLVRTSKTSDDSSSNDDVMKSQYTYDNWDQISRGFQEPKKRDRIMVTLNFEDKFHIKPKNVRRNVASLKVYDRTLKRVNDLKSYIHFVKDHKEDFRKKEPRW